jgi:dTDP-4-amino-4,6-dideoxygalactose transaminase
VEDAAQAFGSSYLGRPLGTWGDAGCLSFFPTKVLGAAGDAGMVVTPDETVAARVRRLRQHGVTAEGRYSEIGGNFRLDGVQAAILGAKMPHFDRWLERRRAHARAYTEAFREMPDVVLLDEVPENSWNGAIYTILGGAWRRDEDLLRARAASRTGTREPRARRWPVHRERARRS